MSRVAEIRVAASGGLAPPPKRVVVIAGAEGSRRIHEFADTAHVIARVKERGGALLFALGKEAFGGRRSTGVPFFADLQRTPHESRIARRRSVVLLDDPRPPILAVVGELADVCAERDGEQAVLGVPGEAPHAVTREIAVGIVGEGGPDARLADVIRGC